MFKFKLLLLLCGFFLAGIGLAEEVTGCPDVSSEVEEMDSELEEGVTGCPDVSSAKEEMDSEYAEEERLKREIAQRIEAVLDANDVRYFNEDGMIKCGARLEHSEYSELLLTIEPRTIISTLSATVSFKTSLEAYGRMTEFIVRLNNTMRYTHYIMDLRDGEIILRCDLNVEELEKDGERVLLSRLVYCVRAFLEHTDAFVAIDKNLITPIKAIELLENEMPIPTSLPSGDKQRGDEAEVVDAEVSNDDCGGNE